MEAIITISQENGKIRVKAEFSRPCDPALKELTIIGLEAIRLELKRLQD